MGFASHQFCCQACKHTCSALSVIAGPVLNIMRFSMGKAPDTGLHVLRELLTLVFCMHTQLQCF